MSRVAFLFRTDVHLADRSPDSWKGDYPAEIWSNLEQIGGLAREHKVDAVLDGGDYFHIKAASKNSHAMVSRSALTQKGYPCPSYVIEGNHDITYNNLDSIERQPLGVLFETGVFHRLRDQVFESGDLRVRVVGLPYSPNRTLEEIQAIQKQPGDTHLVLVLHQLAMEKPSRGVSEFFREEVFQYSDLVTPQGPDVFLFGHLHKDQGVVETGGKIFVNQGAVSRGALNQENLDRQPQVALIELVEGKPKISLLPLVVAPASEVFDLARKERADQENHSVDQFILRLQQDATVDTSKSIEDNVQALSFAEDVRKVALEYLDRARNETA